MPNKPEWKIEGKIPSKYLLGKSGGREFKLPCGGSYLHSELSSLQVWEHNSGDDSNSDQQWEDKPNHKHRFVAAITAVLKVDLLPLSVS